MILVDTSVWIDFFRADNLPHVQRLETLIEQGENIVLLHNDRDFTTVAQHYPLQIILLGH